MGLENIRVVLVDPLYGGNVGSVCRAMANMGLRHLVIAGAGTFPLDEARVMACRAQAVLDGRRHFATLAEAVADCCLVFGTTARGGLYRAHARSPREWIPRAREASDHGPVAFVFGREDNGLTNEELALCTHLIRIPSAPEYPSLNVAHAVLICAYELFCAAGSYVPPAEKSPEAPSHLRERMFAMWRQSLLAIGFMKKDKADHMMMGLRRIFSRGKLTEDDVRILMGVARQTLWTARRFEAEGPQPLDGTLESVATDTGAGSCEESEQSVS